MTDKSDDKNLSERDEARLKARREFVSKFGKMTATAPAVVLMLSAGTKRTAAGDAAWIGSRD